MCEGDRGGDASWNFITWWTLEKGGNVLRDAAFLILCTTGVRQAALGRAIALLQTAILAVVPVSAQLIGMVTLSTEGRCTAAIAQLGERQTEDLKVPNSIPGLGRKKSVAILAQDSSPLLGSLVIG